MTESGEAFAERTDWLPRRPSRQTKIGAAAPPRFRTEANGGSVAHRPADHGGSGPAGGDLLTAAAGYRDAYGIAPVDSGRGALLLQIEAFVQRHLCDPDLTPVRVAAAHHISVSYLHRLFGVRDSTVAAWIRGQRLEHARRDLGDPALDRVPVHRIAARWGFKDHPTFSRAFRSAYGASPTAYRHTSDATAE